MSLLRVCMLQLKIPHATAEIEDPCVLQVRPDTAKKINIKKNNNNYVSITLGNYLEVGVIKLLKLKV